MELKIKIESSLEKHYCKICVFQGGFNENEKDIGGADDTSVISP